mmetsp:Transcript_43370/g.98032  ORF Transcript_43370/g.98032 Transcript_43370/m.98032 type:complete len:178 (+) Transcript_43370:640-1173(+)
MDRVEFTAAGDKALDCKEPAKPEKGCDSGTLAPMPLPPPKLPSEPRRHTPMEPLNSSERGPNARLAPPAPPSSGTRSTKFPAAAPALGHVLGDVLDEAAQARAFKEAVLEWRSAGRADSKTRIERARTGAHFETEDRAGDRGGAAGAGGLRLPTRRPLHLQGRLRGVDPSQGRPSQR